MLDEEDLQSSIEQLSLEVESDPSIEQPETISIDAVVDKTSSLQITLAQCFDDLEDIKQDEIRATLISFQLHPALEREPLRKKAMSVISDTLSNHRPINSLFKTDEVINQYAGCEKTHGIYVVQGNVQLNLSERDTYNLRTHAQGLAIAIRNALAKQLLTPLKISHSVITLRAAERKTFEAAFIKNPIHSLKHFDFSSTINLKKIQDHFSGENLSAAVEAFNEVKATSEMTRFDKVLLIDPASDSDRVIDIRESATLLSQFRDDQSKQHLETANNNIKAREALTERVLTSMLEFKSFDGSDVEITPHDFRSELEHEHRWMTSPKIKEELGVILLSDVSVLQHMTQFAHKYKASLEEARIFLCYKNGQYLCGNRPPKLVRQKAFYGELPVTLHGTKRNVDMVPETPDAKKESSSKRTKGEPETPPPDAAKPPSPW